MVMQTADRRRITADAERGFASVFFSFFSFRFLWIISTCSTPPFSDTPMNFCRQAFAADDIPL
jgi:hypothetical protein